MRSGPSAAVWSRMSRLPDPSVVSWALTAAHTSWDLELWAFGKEIKHLFGARLEKLTAWGPTAVETFGGS